MDLAVIAEPEVASVHTSVSRVSRGKFVPVKASSARTDEVTTQIGGAAYPRAPTLPINTWKMRVYLGSAQSLNNNTFTVVNFDNVSYDSAGGWDSTNHQYVVPLAGYYSVFINTSFAGPGLWLYFVVACNFRVNGVAQAIAQQNYGTFAALADGNVDQNVNYNCNTSDTQYFNQGDVVDVRAYQQNSAAAASNLATGTASTYFTMHLISV